MYKLVILCHLGFRRVLISNGDCFGLVSQGSVNSADGVHVMIVSLEKRVEHFSSHVSICVCSLIIFVTFDATFVCLRLIVVFVTMGVES